MAERREEMKYIGYTLIALAIAFMSASYFYAKGFDIGYKQAYKEISIK